MKSKAIVLLGMAYPGGATMHFAQLGCALFSACKEERDFYYASIDREADNGVWQLVHTRIPNKAVLVEHGFESLVKRVVALAKDYERVVVHCGGGWFQTRAFVLAKWRLPRSLSRRVKLVVTTHSFRNGTWQRIPMSMLQCGLYLFFCVKVVFQCQYAQRQFAGSWLLRLFKKASVVPLGCEPFVSEKHSDLVDRTKFNIVYLSAFRPGKMHEWLVDAMAPVLRKYDDVRLLFCGRGDGQIVACVRNRIRALGLEGKVLLTGHVPREDVPAVLHDADCAIVPSRSETFGHNFLEPMLAGKPVIGTRVGVGCDIIKEGETGFFIDLKHPESVEVAFERLLASRERCVEMGARARSITAAVYTHANVARLLMAVYDEVK